MKSFKISTCIILLIVFINSAMAQKMDWNKLNEEEKRVILNKGTEAPFTGDYYLTEVSHPIKPSIMR